MGKVRKRESYYEGTTNTLVDGQPRKVVLCALVTEEETSDVDVKTVVRGEGDKKIITTVQEVIPYVHSTLKIGLSVLNPLDAPAANPELSKEIAKGKALKGKSSIGQLTARGRFFNKYMTDQILTAKLNDVLSNPDKYIKVTANVNSDGLETLIDAAVAVK